MNGGVFGVEPWCVRFTRDGRARDSAYACKPNCLCEAGTRIGMPNLVVKTDGYLTVRECGLRLQGPSVRSRVRRLQVACRTRTREEGMI